MSKVQTRRSISLRASTVARLEIRARALGIAVSALLEQLIAEAEGAELPPPRAVGPGRCPHCKRAW